MCILIPPTEELGDRVTDTALLDELLATRGNPAAVTAMAQRIGAQHGLPDADHFHVPVEHGTVCAPMMESGHIVAFAAAWRNPT